MNKLFPIILFFVLGCQTKSNKTADLNNTNSLASVELEKIHFGDIVYRRNCVNCHLKSSNTPYQPSIDSMQNLLRLNKDLLVNLTRDSLHSKYYKFLSTSDIENLKLYIEKHSNAIP